MAISFMNALFTSGGGDLEQTPFWVLMTLCWHVHEDDAKSGVGKCWPAIRTIAEKAHVSELTARKAIKTLIEKGLITAHQPAGGIRTFTIRLDRLKDLSGGKDTDPLKDVYPPKEVEGGKELAGGPLKMLQGTPERSCRGPLKDVEPETGIETGKETVSEVGNSAEDRLARLSPAELTQEDSLFPLVEKPKKASKRKPKAEIAKPDDVTEQTWEDFKTVRKAHRAPITETAIEGLRREADKAGVSLEEALKFSVRQGYRGFRASWYRQDEQKAAKPWNNGNRALQREDMVYTDDF